MKTVLSVLLCLIITITTKSQTTLQHSKEIAAFCKIWGFLKYYHPLVSKGSQNWDKEFTTRISQISSLHSRKEISEYYSSWISSLGEVATCKKCNNDVPDSLKYNLNLSWLSDSSMFDAKLIAQLKFIRENRNQSENYYVRQTGIGNTTYKNEKPYKDSIYPSIQLRLLGLSRYWNIINYFYPYKYAIGEDWNNALTEMIPVFYNSKDTLEYHLAMLQLTAKLNDSHAGFVTYFTNSYFGLKWAPFTFRLIDNKAIVTGFYNDSLCKLNNIKIGDIFLTVNNLPIAEIIKEKSKYIGASNDAARLSTMYYAIFNGNSDSVNVTFERDGKVTKKNLRRYYLTDFLFEGLDAKKSTSSMLDSNIGYINMGKLQPKDVTGTINKFKKAKAIIFDARNYPNWTIYQIANLLNSSKQPFAKFTTPNMSYPGVFNKYIPAITCGENNLNYYKGKVVLLFNERTQSQAEFTMMALQTAPNVISIGSNTVGADGDISIITFPGGYQTWMTGLGVYYPDGRETQRIGLIPNIKVVPSIEGIKQGRDEVLEKAIEIINSK